MRLLPIFPIILFLSVAAAEKMSMNVSPVQKLVEYRYATEFGQLLPGIRYNNSIIISWAVSDSALQGLDGRTITIKATAKVENGSAVSFLSPLGLQAKSAEAYLRCEVQNGTCSNSSNLTAQIPFFVFIGKNESEAVSIIVESEIVGSQEIAGAEEMQKATEGILESIKSAFSQNSSLQNNAGSSHEAGKGEANATGNLLDSLKPEGDAKNPVEFLRANPIISIAALAIVIIITGAYLINAKD